MKTRNVLAISVLAAVLSTGLLFAEAGGSGDLFLSHAATQATGGNPFARETWTDRHRWASDNTAQASSLTAVEPAGRAAGPRGSAAQPLASGFGRGAVAYAQAASLSHVLGIRHRTGSWRF